MTRASSSSSVRRYRRPALLELSKTAAGFVDGLS